VSSGTWWPRTGSKSRACWTAHTASAVFRVATLNKKVALGAEMGEEMALRVLAAKILALCWCLSVSVVVEDVVLGEVAGTLQKVATHPLGERRSRRRCKEEKERQQAQHLGVAHWVVCAGPRYLCVAHWIATAGTG